jgi:hypothetical protein
MIKYEGLTAATPNGGGFHRYLSTHLLRVAYGTHSFDPDFVERLNPKSLTLIVA